MTEARPYDVRQHFAQRLKELRAARGFRTARSLAQALAIDENRYTRYERAEVEPDLALLLRMCETLAATPNDLLLGWAQRGAEAPLPGFAEKAEAAARGRPRALAWRLAGELARLRARPDAPLANLQIKSRLFSDIERDPFSFVSRWAEDPALVALDGDAQARIAALMDDLIATISRADLA
jgi:transcriptional regulator with XRE-family HTH domain